MNSEGAQLPLLQAYLAAALPQPVVRRKNHFVLEFAQTIRELGHHKLAQVRFQTSFP